MMPDLGGAILFLAVAAAAGFGLLVGGVVTVVLFACGLTSWAILLPPPLLALALAALLWSNR